MGVINKKGQIVNSKIFLVMLGTIPNWVSGNHEYVCFSRLVTVSKITTPHYLTCLQASVIKNIDT